MDERANMEPWQQDLARAIFDERPTRYIERPCTVMSWRRIAEAFDLPPELSEGGYLVPERIPQRIQERGLRRLLVRLRILKPRYEWVEIRRLLEERIAGRE